MWEWGPQVSVLRCWAVSGLVGVTIHKRNSQLQHSYTSLHDGSDKLEKLNPIVLIIVRLSRGKKMRCEVSILIHFDRSFCSSVSSNVPKDRLLS